MREDEELDLGKINNLNVPPIELITRPIKLRLYKLKLMPKLKLMLIVMMVVQAKAEAHDDAEAGVQSDAQIQTHIEAPQSSQSSLIKL